LITKEELVMIWRMPEFTFYNILVQSYCVHLLAGIEKCVKYIRKNVASGAFKIRNS